MPGQKLLARATHGEFEEPKANVGCSGPPMKMELHTNTELGYGTDGLHTVMVGGRPVFVA